MAYKSNLGAAKAAKNDEFYTQYADIQKEINAYLEYNPDAFRDKTVLLPCDNPEWSIFIVGSPKRQDYLVAVLDWVSRGWAEEYLAKHRYEDSIQEMKTYFRSVIDWVTSVFDFAPEKGMCGLLWGEPYEKYHNNAYDPSAIATAVKRLNEGFFVKEKKGIFEYVLGGCQEPRLLNVRVFDEPTKKAVYAGQTMKVEEKGISNCPYYAVGHDANRTRIRELAEMDADHDTT